MLKYLVEILQSSSIEIKEKEAIKLLYHHARPLESVKFDIVYPLRRNSQLYEGLNSEFAGENEWMEQYMGFYPLFLAVGKNDNDLRLTGYQNQWRKLLSYSLKHREYRQKGDDENYVLFSYAEMPTLGIFSDAVNTFPLLNLHLYNGGKDIKLRDIQSIFRPSWIKNDWISYANKNPGTVQLVAPSLDLRKAERVLVRNQKTKDGLEEMGFST